MSKGGFSWNRLSGISGRQRLASHHNIPPDKVRTAEEGRSSDGLSNTALATGNWSTGRCGSVGRIMLPPSHMSWVTASCSSPQHFLYDFARRSAHLRVPNLLASDQTTVDSLP